MMSKIKRRAQPQTNPNFTRASKRRKVEPEVLAQTPSDEKPSLPRRLLQRDLKGGVVKDMREAL